MGDWLQSLPWLHWWQAADWVVRGIFVLLWVLSILAWTIILAKGWQLLWIGWREARLGRWLDQSLALPERFLTPSRWVAGQVQARSLGGSGGDQTQRHLDQVLQEQRLLLESRLTLLASIGSSAPFIGLLGTVWGIMHALGRLQGTPTLTIDLVAGPVGEALVATALGLFTAIPAVVGYNLLLRRLRRVSVRITGNALRLLDREPSHPASAALGEGG